MESVKILQKPLTINSNIIVVDDRALKYAKIIDTVMSKTFLRKLKDMDITVYVTTLYEYYAEWKKKAEYRDTEIKEVDIGSSGFITLFNEDLAIIYISLPNNEEAQRRYRKYMIPFSYDPIHEVSHVYEQFIHRFSFGAKCNVNSLIVREIALTVANIVNDVSADYLTMNIYRQVNNNVYNVLSRRMIKSGIDSIIKNMREYNILSSALHLAGLTRWIVIDNKLFNRYTEFIDKLNSNGFNDIVDYTLKILNYWDKHLANNYINKDEFAELQKRLFDMLCPKVIYSFYDDGVLKLLNKIAKMEV